MASTADGDDDAEEGRELTGIVAVAFVAHGLTSGVTSMASSGASA